MGDLLEGKGVVIAGGDSGLGKDMAIAAAKEGARVVVGCLHEEAGKASVAEILEASGNEAIYVVGDLTEVSACEDLFVKALEYLGKIDGMIYYAGILPAFSLLDTEEELYNSVADLNVRGAFFCSKFAVKAMLEGGGGSIIHIGSPHATGGQIDRAAYSVSKGGLLTLTKHISRNYAKDQIRCNQIKIGWMATPGEIALRESLGMSLDELNAWGAECVPMGRLQVGGDFVGASNYLLSDLSSQLTGTIMNVNGGLGDHS
ncbi:MAG: SDR family oxidoreductase [Kiritimatiellia bacterium]|jgi:NAD(P)-dependent dehydrogenase (short-subunit alcohol dehydrogenase family)|nr:SDR family oxidoreductase [Kiritimatiellia bacterium]